MRGQITASKDRIEAFKTQLANAQVSFEKLAAESSETKANLRVEMVATKQSLVAERAHVKRFERELATLVQRRQQILPERTETSQTASHPLAEGEDSLRGLQLKVAAITADRNEWYDHETEALAKQNAAKADVALRLTYREAVRYDMIAHTGPT